MIGDCDLEFGLEIGIWDWILALDTGDLDWGLRFGIGIGYLD